MSTKRPERPAGNTPPTKKTKEKTVKKFRMSSAEDRLQSLPGGIDAFIVTNIVHWKAMHYSVTCVRIGFIVSVKEYQVSCTNN